MNILQLGLDAQAMSIGKGPKESAAAQPLEDAFYVERTNDIDHSPAPAADPVQPKDYVDQDYCPVDLVCPSCGRKHWDTFPTCLSCSQMD